MTKALSLLWCLTAPLDEADITPYFGTRAELKFSNELRVRECEGEESEASGRYGK